MKRLRPDVLACLLHRLKVVDKGANELRRGPGSYLSHDSITGGTCVDRGCGEAHDTPEWEGQTMIYMLEINTLVAVAVFGLAGVFILGLFIWSEAMKYAQADRAMQRIRTVPSRESFVISRSNRETHETVALRIADSNRVS